MGLDLAAADAVLKEDYKGPVREQLNMGTPVLAEMERDTEMVVGRQAIIPLHTGRSEAVGARADGGSLPTARNQRYKEAKENVTYQYGKIEITLPTIEAMKSDEGAFLRAVDSETKGMTSNLKEDFDRQLCFNNSTGLGKLVEFAANVTQTQLNVQNADRSTRRRIRKGMFIDVYNSAGTSEVVDNREVTAVAVNSSGVVTSVTIAGAAITTVAGDIAVRTDSVNEEMIGIPGVISASGTLHGVDPATETYWKSSEKDASAAAISEDLLQQLLDEVADEAGEEPSRIYCERTQRRKFAATQISLKRHVNTMQLKGGFTAITFNDNIPFITDRHFEANKVWMANPKHLKLAEQTDWDWADQDGAVLSRVSGKPAFEAFLYKFANLVTDRRNAHGLLKNLSTA